jgi:hypothetical protein
MIAANLRAEPWRIAALKDVDFMSKRSLVDAPAAFPQDRLNRFMRFPLSLPRLVDESAREGKTLRLSE